MGGLEQWLAFSLLLNIYLERRNWKHSCLLSAVLAVFFPMARNIDKQSLKRGGKMVYLSVDFDVF